VPLLQLDDARYRHPSVSHLPRGDTATRIPAITSRGRSAAPLADRLDEALSGSESRLRTLWGAEPVDAGDAVRTLLRIHDLYLAPLVGHTGGSHRQHHPVVAELKWRLEAEFLHGLEVDDAERSWHLPDDPVAALGAVEASDRVPWLYHWLAERASAAELATFLELEGGPDGGFDDLVAHCQIGLDPVVKLELARAYWDEMGRGDPAAVHAELHRTMAATLGLRDVPRSDQPEAALRRTLLGSMLATNRWLQPEMVGALGLIELLSGPRCRKVAAALTRLGAPEPAARFYEEHARAGPCQGRRWVEHVVAPLADRNPEFAWRIVRGARWRSTVDARFIEAAGSMLGLTAGNQPGSEAASGRMTTVLCAVDGGWVQSVPS
jgi:hypothetical protein